MLNHNLALPLVFEKLRHPTSFHVSAWLNWKAQRKQYDTERFQKVGEVIRRIKKTPLNWLYARARRFVRTEIPDAWPTDKCDPIAASGVQSVPIVQKKFLMLPSRQPLAQFDGSACVANVSPIVQYNLTVKELKLLCKNNGLVAGGRKEV